MVLTVYKSRNGSLASVRYPFNPEAGSVGSPEVESMREMMTEQDLAGFPRKGFYS